MRENCTAINFLHGGDLQDSAVARRDHEPSKIRKLALS